MPNIPRIIWLKYPSHCVVCDRAMARGEKALWSPTGCIKTQRRGCHKVTQRGLIAHPWHFGEEERKTPNLLDKVARR